MPTITIGSRSFETPVLVPSISSFETQIRPLDALRLQLSLREPISLISAYDVWYDRSALVQLAKDFRKTGILLLDSGGYESSRIASYAGNALSSRWDYSKYAEIAGEDIYDFIFSFDYFLDHTESVKDFGQRIAHEFSRHHKILDKEKLIPVIHVQSIDGGRRLATQEILDLFQHLARNTDSRFVAIPERELGDGISTRVQIAKSISQVLTKHARTECSLHILGCGNLLSFSLLAVAGAVMCDGLEWCRTFAADNFHLHHFQQKEMFVDPKHYVGNPIAEFFIEQANLNYRTSVAVRNLLSFQAFTRILHSNLQTRSVHEFVRDNFGHVAGDAVAAIET